MRKAQTNPISKARLLDAAQELILKKGFASTSVEEICQKAKLTKGTFFHYFNSKEALGKAVLERFCCNSRRLMEQSCSCEDKEKDPLKRVYSHLDCAIAMSKSPENNKGCLIGMLAQEMADTSPAIREVCEQGFGEWVKLFKKDLDAAKAKYAPRAGFDTQNLAEYFVALVEGSIVLTKARPEHKFLEKNMQLFKDHLKMIFKK